ncbi:MAG: hypothetical protein IJ787_04325 [Bacilli bacterium]|nr:hypothetical protein [Bacilli bacterium]
MNALLTLGLALASVVSIVSSPKGAYVTKALDVTRSTVAEDLEAFYYGSYGEKTLQNLVPNRMRGDLYDDFKFLHAYPFQGDLYLYFYARAGWTLTEASAWITVRNLIDNDYDEFAIHSTSDGYDARIVSTYGKMNVFYKCVIDDFYEHRVGDKHAITVDAIVGTCDDDDLYISRACDGDEVYWEDTEDYEDLVYKYYKDDYILIDDAEYIQQWVATQYDSVDLNYPTEVRELNWLFFSWNGSSADGKYELGDLKAIRLDYEYLTYTASYTIDSHFFLADTMTPVYCGTYHHPEIFVNACSNVNVRDIKIEGKVSEPRQTVVKAEQRFISEDVATPDWWQFWENVKHLDYAFNTIQKLDAESIDALGEDHDKDFFNANKGGYEYAIMMKEDTRKRDNVQELRFDGWNEFWSNSKRITSTAHEMVSATITRLTFSTEYGDVDLNAMMEPVELTGVMGASGKITDVKDYYGPSVKDVLRYAVYAIAAIGVLTVLGFAITFIVRQALKAQPSRPNDRSKKRR